MPRLRRALGTLPDLSGMRLACSMHIDLKIVPLIEGLIAKGAHLFLLTCNPNTVRDEVVAYLNGLGIHVQARKDMAKVELDLAIEEALAWHPTHLCEFGADISASLHEKDVSQHTVRAGLEGTSSGIARLRSFKPLYPIFNWNDLPIKEGLHNKHMVGLTTWQMFFNRTQLTLHEKNVVVIGYGSVGQGVAATARAYGGAVTIVERETTRSLQAAFDGWRVLPLEDALPDADVIVTATGARDVLGFKHWPLLKDGAFLLNVGHSPNEIDVSSLRVYPHRQVMPYIEEFSLDDGMIYLIAGGSMANLTAGSGDSLNAFDVTLAVLSAGIGFIADSGADWPAGVHILPTEVWKQAVEGVSE